jgi:hypothetical protein
VNSHYIADPSASRLASGHGTCTIGLAVPMHRPVGLFSRSVSGVEAVVAERGLRRPARWRCPVRVVWHGFVEDLPFRKRVDGLLLIDAPARSSRSVLASVHSGCGDGHRGTGGRTTLSSLVVDNVAAARLAVGPPHRPGPHADRPDRRRGGRSLQHFTVPLERYNGLPPGVCKIRRPRSRTRACRARQLLSYEGGRRGDAPSCSRSTRSPDRGLLLLRRDGHRRHAGHP